MEELTLKTRKFSLNFGVLFGVFSIVFSLMLYSSDLQYENGILVQTIPYVLLAIAIILGINQFKKANNGFLKLKQGVKIGVLAAFIGALIAAIYYYVFVNFIQPDFLDKLFEIQKQQAMEANPSLSIEQMNQGVEMQKQFAWIFYPAIVFLYTLFGLIVGLVTGLIMKKEKSAF
jgi:hypothetical protein